MNNPVTITPSASQEIRQIFEQKNIPKNYALRIGVKGAGCSGVDYVLGFDESSDADQVFKVDEFEVIVSKKDFMHLLGVTVDFIEDAEVRGFVFKNN